MTNETKDSAGDTMTGSLQRLNDLATTRRRFLMGAGGVVAVGVLAACGDDGTSSDTTAPKSSTTGDDSSTTAPSDDGAGDLTIGAFAASLEVLAVNTYTAALDAATGNKLGEVPPAVAEFVTTAMGHHQEALDAWNKVLGDAGEDEVTEPPADLKATVDTEFAKVTDVVGAAKLALMLEQIAAATYLEAIPVLTTEPAIALAASIQPIDMQHAAVLLFVLGEYPVPDNFAKTDMSAVPK